MRPARPWIVPLAAAASLTAVLALSGCSAAPAAGPSFPADWTTSMLAQVNAQRAAAGVAPLVACGALARSAQAQSNGQAAMHKMSHVGPDGSTLVIRVARAGYAGWTALAENVAAGFGDVGAVMTGWMNDPTHRTNLLDPSYTHVGFGVADGGGLPYWTQDFGRGGTC